MIVYIVRCFLWLLSTKPYFFVKQILISVGLPDQIKADFAIRINISNHNSTKNVQFNFDVMSTGEKNIPFDDSVCTNHFVSFLF